MSQNKTVCPVSRSEFKAHAKPLTWGELADLIGRDTPIDDRGGATGPEFSTKSLGWYYTGKVNVPVNGSRPKVQVGLNMTVVGSKELPS